MVNSLVSGKEDGKKHQQATQLLHFSFCNGRASISIQKRAGYRADALTSATWIFETASTDVAVRKSTWEEATQLFEWPRKEYPVHFRPFPNSWRNQQARRKANQK